MAVVLTLICAAGALPGVASAQLSGGPGSTASVNSIGGTLTVNGNPGYHNVITLVDAWPAGYGVKDTTGITAGSNCAQVDFTTVFCQNAGTLVVNGNDYEDQISLTGGPVNSTANGGAHNDRLTGSNKTGWRYNGGDLNDTIIVSGQGGAIIDGGAGIDIIDTVIPTTVYGGSGHDEVILRPGMLSTDSALVYGGDGDDIVRGSPGRDIVYGELGQDTVYGFDNPEHSSCHPAYQTFDLLVGGANDDYLEGGLGPDDLQGGDGVDWVVDDRATGQLCPNYLSGGIGDDLLDSHNFKKDYVYCDAGWDRVQASDFFDQRYDCEEVW